MNLRFLLEVFLKKSLISLAESLGVDTSKLREKSLIVEIPKEEHFGDYACTSAMDREIREILNIRNPRELAMAWLPFIKNTVLEKNEIHIPDPFHFFHTITFEDLFEDVQIAGSGFLNFFLSQKVLIYFLYRALKEKENYGRVKSSSPRKIIFEFVSANPTGPLNVVSARAAALGDSCCNLLEATGDEVYREYYVNDYGNQVELLGISFLFRFLELHSIPLKFSQKTQEGIIYPETEGLPFPPEAYHGEYIKEALQEILQKNPVTIEKDELQRIREFSKNPHLQEKDLVDLLDEKLRNLANHFSQLAVEYFLEQHRKELHRFRVTFHNFFLESSLHRSNKVFQVVDRIKPYVYEKDGKIFFQSTLFGDDQDRVIVRENGKPTYFLADVAYHNEKIERGFTHIINIWGPDHHGYMPRLKGAVKALGFPEENFKILIAQQVTLFEDGKPVVMSKRAGKIIQMKELLDEIPVDVARYFFVMRSFESHLDFDLNEAKDTSEKNPYYYVAYAHARIRSIIKKIEEEKIFSFHEEKLLEESELHSLLEKFFKYDFSAKHHFQNPDFRRSLLVKIARLPEEIYHAAINFEPHRLVYYLYQVAGDLAKFYGKKENKIIEKQEEEAKILLLILIATGICLKNGLQLLGMEAPDRLEKSMV